jgi:transcriptional regulator with XRE-family HTH domain
MTFGETIQKLRKESGLSQEELADQLGVSRQAVSKWETDNGYPETEKMIRMSRIFNVTLDDLLNADDLQTKDAAAEHGIYVSREMAAGFLFYQKRKLLKIALAAGLLTGSLALSFVDMDMSILIFVLVWIIGIVLLFSVRLADHPYRKLWKEPLTFDKAVKAELNAAYAEKKRGLQLCTLAGITLIACGLLICPMLVPAESFLADAVVLSVGMVMAGVGVFLCVLMSGLIRAYRLLVLHEPNQKKGK